MTAALIATGYLFAPILAGGALVTLCQAIDRHRGARPEHLTERLPAPAGDHGDT